MKDDNYIVIQGWMINRLKLKGNDLIIYAVIYGFSQSGEDQEYTGSLQYLTDCTGASKPTVINILKKLVAEGLITKKEKIVNGVKFCSYSADLTGSKEILPGVVKKLDRGSKETLPGGGKETLHNNTNTYSKRNTNGKNKQEELLTDLPEGLQESVRNFIQMRKEIKAPMTDEALRLMLKKLRSMSKNTDTQVEIINQSIMNGWKGIFPIDRGKTSTQDNQTQMLVEWAMEE